MTPTATTYQLVPPPAAPPRPVLDADQQRVVDHTGGPLLVLAGPGTGKTTTLVEAIADRIERRGTTADQVLALTFSRKAAEQLRDRVTARVGRTLSTSLSSTFHSFAYALIRRYAPAELYEAPLRLLSAPEQDVVIQELLSHAPESVRWPDTLCQAVGTRGFAREVLDVLARAREKGFDGPALAALGRAHGEPAYEAAGIFLDQYLDILDSRGFIDYADLIRRAVIEAEAHRDELRARFAHVFVDEYQDTDPSQVRLLRALAGDGRDLTVVGDPHQSIYAFRGAEVRGILEFPGDFRRRDGEPADVVALRTTRRFGPRLLAATSRVAHRLPLPGSIPDSAKAAFLDPRAEAPGGDDGRTRVLTFDTERAEAEHVADLLRRAHLEDGLPWAAMAVLVRSGRSTIPSLRRSLAAAGVPVEVASDDTPLAREPAAMTLLDAVRAALGLGVDDPQHPSYVDTVAVSALLASPLAGMDATDVRALARALRLADKEHAGDEGREPMASSELLRRAVLDPRLLDGIPATVAGKAAGLARLLTSARVLVDAGATAGDVLWELWDGTSWPIWLRQRAESGGAAARRAHRDLDAVVALFEAAERHDDQRGHRSVAAFLDDLVAQQIPADTLAERGVRGDAVRLLTAHRAKGLEWDLVVVAHVQEEAWPDLRRRASLLRPERIGRDGLEPPVGTRELLAEERRLFYVACTRARRRLVVTAVASPDDDGEQASRFLAELEISVEHQQGRPRRPLSLAGLVADLRRTLVLPDSPEELRAAAADRLARLAGEEVRGRPLVPAADPARWWGTRATTVSTRPVRPTDEPLRLTASSLGGILECPAKWFLEREAGGESRASQAQGFGNIAHALADRVGRGELAHVSSADELMREVDRVWGELTFRTPWSGPREREELRAALGRFLTWHRSDRGRQVVGTEAEFRCEVELPDGQRVLLQGRVDRLELDTDGRLVVIDLKTGKYPPTDTSLAENPQLGLYQHAIAQGAFLEATGSDLPGGAELWQLRKDVRGQLKVQTQSPQQPGDDGRTLVEAQLASAAEVLRSEQFEARPGGHCERCAFRVLCPTQQSGTVLS